MLSDEQIRAILDRAKENVGEMWLDSRAHVIELCTRVLASEARIKVLEEALKAIRSYGDDPYGIARKALAQSLSPEDKLG